MTRNSSRRRRIALSGTAAVVALTALAGPTSSHASTTTTKVIVTTVAGDVSVAQAVAKLGGEIDRTLPIISGLAVTIRADRLDDLASLPGVVAVTPDEAMTAMSSHVVPASTTAATTDTGTLSAISQIVGAQSMWNAGYTGQGIDIAVIDTGIARVPGLDAPGKVIDGPDLSLDPHDPAVGGIDAFGHGTHMAGIIAGSDVTTPTAKGACNTCLGTSRYTDTTKFVGIAPAARLVNVKVGAFDGATDISQVIAGIDWVVQHAHDPGFNIRVINLSFGTDSTQSAAIDPLSQAVEVAWRKGIVVVAAAGNEGTKAKTVANPALNPTIIAAGASNPNGTLTTSDDSIPDFAQHGDLLRGVDFVAPGVSVVSLRVPGSFVDQNTTTGRVGTRFQRASGTSQSTAVVSGLAALYLSKYPSATPDTVKQYFKTWANPITLLDSPIVDTSSLSSTMKSLLLKVNEAVSTVNRWYSGSGSVNISPSTASIPLPVLPALASVTSATGTGTLEGARGSTHLVAANGTVLQGEVDVMGKPWNASQMAKATAAGSSWNGGTWNGARWSGAAWAGARWSSENWTGNDWSGARWSGARWSDVAWDGARWSGARWSGARWSAGTWSGARWSGARWSDGGWQ